MIADFVRNIRDTIQSRTKEQWVDYLWENIQKLRLKIQENGEISFIVAFVAGIFVVVFFKFFFAVLFLVALFGGLVWCLAESDLERKGSAGNLTPVEKEKKAEDTRSEQISE